MSAKLSSKEVSLEVLYFGLQYVESIAMGAKDKIGQVLRMAAEHKLDKSKLDKDIEKMYDIFMEHDALSFKIEEELDKRLKPRLGNKYTTKTLIQVSTSLDKTLAELLPKEEPQAKGKNPLTIS